MENFVGKGITFPVILEKGRPKLYTGLTLIRSSLAVILAWDGDRILLPEFKSTLVDLLGEPNDKVLATLVEFFISNQIRQWEKRVELLEVTAKSSRTEPGRLDVVIVYKIKNTDLGETLVYPFYTSINN